MLLKIEFLITKMFALRAAAAFYNKNKNVKSITCSRKVSAPVGQIIFPQHPCSLLSSFQSCLSILLFFVCPEIKWNVYSNDENCFKKRQTAGKWPQNDMPKEATKKCRRQCPLCSTLTHTHLALLVVEPLTDFLPSLVYRPSESCQPQKGATSWITIKASQHLATYVLRPAFCV